MKPIDRRVRRKCWLVYRMNRGTWQEIYRTPDEQKARNEADRMKSWDCPTKVVQKEITIIESV